MMPLIEFAPLVVFFGLYQLADIYVATTGLLITSTAQLFFIRWRTGTVSRFRMVGYIVLVCFSGLTLVLHDPTFIKWKPTIFLGLLALLILITDRMGKPLIARLFVAFDSDLNQIDALVWRKVSTLWSLSYFLQALGNYWFAFYMPESVWVNFKVWGLTLMSFVTIIATAVVLRHQCDSPIGE
ncbi:MAG: septation protein A [Gammaproteobacteria bacterium]|nr:MAG: septation protein A [Gammaproteobacteria bacterium]